jgi:hypothetical protein
MPRHRSEVADVEQRRSSMPKRRQRHAARLCAARLTVILLYAAAGASGAQDFPWPGEGRAFTATPSVASPCEIRERRVMREERPFWRRVLALPADALELAFWPLRQTIFWMERDDVPGRVRDAALYPIEALTGAGPEPTP